jgi:hypothetical protein
LSTDKPVDGVAESVTDFLAVLLMHYRLKHFYRLRHSSAFEFWQTAIVTYCTQAKSIGFYNARSIVVAQLLEQMTVPHQFQGQLPECSHLPIQSRLERILYSGKITPSDQQALRKYACKHPLSDREGRLFNQIFQALKQGRVRVIE